MHPGPVVKHIRSSCALFIPRSFGDSLAPEESPAATSRQSD